ncbi:MAG: CvpA family protein [Gammaproteobacteria bacterium]|nr:CvpA family protein [Gammaproteobacteria bacterium]MDE0489650.1 CvpA family protein [Gammaproteobacteria bacterium]
MTLFDWIVLVIFLSAAWLGMKRGFLSAALSLATWVAGVFLAFAFGDIVVATLLSGWPAKIEVWLANNPLAGAIFRGPSVAESVALWAARLGVLVVVLVIGSTLAGLVSRAVENSVLASANRALGVLLGAAKGWLIAGGLLLLCIHVGPETWVQGSMSLPFLEPVSDALSLLLKALGGR